MTSQNLVLALGELSARTFSTGKITHSHRRILLEALGSSELQEPERSAIDRLLGATVRDRLIIIDE